MNNFFKRNWQHFAVIAVMLVVTLSYFNLQLSGYGLKQHDIAQHRGMSHEVVDYRERTGEEVLWTNSMFGGMPAFQISVVYKGNVFGEAVITVLKVLSSPAGIVLLYMIGFYIMMLCLRINPWIGLLGALAFAFSTYDIIILQAGHNSKGLAVAFMAPVLGAFIMAYQRNLKWGVLLSAMFMSIQVAMNHLQITYYLGILLVFVGLVLLVQALIRKEIKRFALATGGLFAAYGIALFMNYGNISLTNDYSKYTIRGGNDVTITPEGVSNAANSTTGLDKDYVTQWSYGIGESFTLLSPYVKGGGTVALADSPFADMVEDMDLSSEEAKGVMNYPVYWGEQPMTSGPVYLGIVVVFLAFIGLVFLKNPIKWALLATAILTLALSWGKNYMGLTNFFLDHVPGYNKFRAVTIILVVIELCAPVIGVLLLDQFWKERASLKEQKKKFLIASGAFLVVLLMIKFVGLGDGYRSSNDDKQLSGIEGSIRGQLAGMDPAVLQSQYNLDITNPQQVDEFVRMQAEPYIKNFDAMKQVREEIFQSSMNRSFFFALFSAALLGLLFFTEVQALPVVLGLVVLVMVDLIPVARNYLGNQELGSGYKYWDVKVNALYPISATSADAEILQMETEQSVDLQSKILAGEKEGKQKAEELGLTGTESRRVIDAYKFRALNRNTNYRVFDFSGGFSSANASYFHKSLGGYHGAKLRNIQNLFDFHIAKSNNKVFDMLNVKYFIQPGEGGAMTARPNPTAMGVAWLAKKVESFETPNEEILALGNQFDFVNIGAGQLLLNGSTTQKAKAFGSENLQYVLQGDTISIPLMNGLREGMEAFFVMDRNGKTDFVLKQMIDADTSRSFLRLVEMKVSNEFNPSEEVVMLKSEAAKLKNKVFSGVGSVRMTGYAPNKMNYEVQADGNQLVVFSEIYYPAGWKAYVDNKEVPILKANYLLRAVEVPAGKHAVEFRFEVPKYKQANTFAWIGSIVILLGIAWGLWSDRRASAEQ